MKGESDRRKRDVSASQTPREGDTSATQRMPARTLGQMATASQRQTQLIPQPKTSRALAAVEPAARRSLFRITPPRVNEHITHVWRARADGPWIVTDDDDTTSARELRSFLLNTRYWWLEGAPTDSIRRGIANVFDKYDIETIAPGYGCILRGRNVVARHYQMLDEILKRLDKRVAVSRYVGRDEER